MQVSRISQGIYSQANLNKSSVNFGAKLIITDDAKKFLAERAIAIGRAVETDEVKAIVSAKQIGQYLSAHLNSLVRKVEDVEPKDFVIKYDLSDEYKAFQKTGQPHSEFDAVYDRVFELRFGTEEDQKLLRSEGGRADFNMYIDAMGEHMEQLNRAIRSRMVLFQKK